MIAPTPRKFFYALSLLSVTLTAGCSTTTLEDYVSIDSRASIKTDPAGARVVVDDKEVGTTPMEFEAENIFPPHWEGTSYMVKSKLEIKKKGCKTYTREVRDPIPREISVNLDCQEQYMEPEPKPETASQRKEASPSPVMNKTIEDRLMQVEGLYKKGLINNGEYNELRKKILKDI